MNEYEKQAKDFLAKTDTTLTIKRYPDDLAPEANWDNHGHAYKVTLERNGVKRSFDFWDSVRNMRLDKRPTAYDVLACLASDTSMEYDDVDELAAEFGYEKPSEAIRVFEGLKKQQEIVKSLYDLEQREMLWEIQ